MTIIRIHKGKKLIEYILPDGSIVEIKDLPLRASKKAVIARLKALGLRWR